MHFEVGHEIKKKMYKQVHINIMNSTLKRYFATYIDMIWSSKFVLWLTLIFSIWQYLFESINYPKSNVERDRITTNVMHV